ncbi:hypothetical protein CIB48_g9814 [Xylaria polymorpha]|nr:hypothetical protein CIB48_g9814 [Xylaria polymorpha]
MSLDPARLTNWPAVRDFVPTAHNDTYPFISTSAADLGGKSVFITGASKGIGKGIALSFARAGCSRIAVAARTGVDELKQQILSAARTAARPEPLVLAIALDVTSPEASLPPPPPSRTPSGESWISSSTMPGAPRLCTPNDTRNALCTRAFLPLLLKSSIRTVIITSSAGAHMLIQNFLGYQTSKTALCRFAEFLAKEYEGQGLVALAAHPGDVLTDVAACMGEEMAPIFKDTPELAGDTMVWLAKERREWLSGRFVSVTWDMRELEQKREEIVSKDLLKMRLTV